jgi:hypothetical protein
MRTALNQSNACCYTVARCRLELVFLTFNVSLVSVGDVSRERTLSTLFSIASIRHFVAMMRDVPPGFITNPFRRYPAVSIRFFHAMRCAAGISSRFAADSAVSGECMTSGAKALAIC